MVFPASPAIQAGSTCLPFQLSHPPRSPLFPSCLLAPPLCRHSRLTPRLPLPPDPDDQYKLTEDTRQLGLVVCRGTSVVLICPQDGMEAIPNPFIQQQDG